MLPRGHGGDSTSGGGSHVGRLVIHGGAAGADALLQRLRAEALLSATTLEPRGLPPAAILCVRHLRDPLPGTVALDRGAPSPPAAWGRAVQSRLDELLRQAARPASGAVPTSADAVVFEDRAELLACALSDWCAGVLLSRWWWPLLLPGPDRAQALLAALRRAPEHAPPALARIAERGELTALALRLDVTEAAPLLAAIVERHALPHLAPVVEAVRAAPPSRPCPVAAGPLAAPTRPDTASPDPFALVPEVASRMLPAATRALLAVAVTLAHAPALARSAAFALALGQRLPDAPSPPSRPANEPPGERPAPARAGRAALEELAAPSPATASAHDAARPIAPTTASPPAARASDEGGPAAAAAAAATATAATPGARADQPASVPVAPAPDVVPAASTAVGDSAAQVDAVTLAVATAPFAEAAGPSAADAAPVEPAPWASSPAWQRRVVSFRSRDRAFGPPTETGLAGVFYLVTVAQRLGLYGRDPDEPNLELPLWDFVEAMARRLLEDATDADWRDEVWRLLAALAGRPDGAPPQPLGPDREAELDAAEARVLDLVRRVFALDETAPAGPALLRHRGRVHVTDTHLDVVLSLDALPIEIRLAGLDRDPGWVPAGGRFLAFHFE